MSYIPFRPVVLSDCETVQKYVYTSECRNCDLNFMNLMSWRFLFQTELAIHQGWLLLRFHSQGRLAYLPPIGDGNWKDILSEMQEDAALQNAPFCLMGVCDNAYQQLTSLYPDRFQSRIDLSSSDYVYLRDTLAQLTGKNLQPKRNHINRFIKAYPDYTYFSLTPDDFEECLELVEKWYGRKEVAVSGRLSLKDELSALRFTFEHWKSLLGQGGVLRVGGQVVAFTYGAPINYDTFDICVEKADVDYEGAFAMINREFARALPEQYEYVNREEDLGIEGLRKAKLSYQPAFLLHKHIVTLK